MGASGAAVEEQVNDKAHSYLCGGPLRCCSSLCLVNLFSADILPVASPRRLPFASAPSHRPILREPPRPLFLSSVASIFFCAPTKLETSRSFSPRSFSTLFLTPQSFLFLISHWSSTYSALLFPFSYNVRLKLRFG